VIRTVHHVDDFTTRALIDCQYRAIVEPDHLLVVSEEWRRILHEEYHVGADVVRNGVDPSRFPPVSAARAVELRASIGARDRFVFLAVGGIEPRKGSKSLFRALGLLRARGQRPMLVILGGHSFRDYEAYRQEALATLPNLGLAWGADVVEVGTVSDDVLAGWYRSADALAFPSTVEGFGLVALEALAADLPVVASDLPVFREFLTDGRDALLPPPDDPVALAEALERVMTDEALRRALVAGGRRIVPSYTWSASATRHAQIYQTVRPV
jgi:glycosyltransferase involved in cell wall biosynthesis